MASPVRTDARCLGCKWTAEGPAADKQAEKHTAIGHPTAVMTRWEG